MVVPAAFAFLGGLAVSASSNYSILYDDNGSRRVRTCLRQYQTGKAHGILKRREKRDAREGVVSRVGSITGAGSSFAPAWTVRRLTVSPLRTRGLGSDAEPRLQLGLSATLAINEEVGRRRASGEQILHLGFGEAGLPVHPILREALSRAAGDGRYGPVRGDAGLRAAVAAAYVRRGLPTAPNQILVGPGSKPLLFALMLAMDGDVVLPRPSWVTYAAQAHLLERRVLRVPTPHDVGGIPDPAGLETEVAAARARRLSPRILLITNPDNPTGTTPSRETLAAVLRVACDQGLTVICDEIYSDLVHDPGQFVSAAVIDPNCVLTGGLSKSHALGGWRVGILRLPATAEGERLGRRVEAIASEIWSALPSPMASAAITAYEAPELVAHVAASSRLHSQVAAALHEAVVSSGAECRAPTAAFYMYPDLERRRGLLAQKGITDGDTLARALLLEYGVAVLPGGAFGDDPAALRFRIASGLLYGADDAERWEALRAADTGSATSLPRIRRAVSYLREALMALMAAPSVA